MHKRELDIHSNFTASALAHTTFVPMTPHFCDAEFSVIAVIQEKEEKEAAGTTGKPIWIRRGNRMVVLNLIPRYKKLYNTQQVHKSLISNCGCLRIN